MCPKKNFGLKIILDLKKIFGPKKNFWSEKILCQKKFGSEKNIGSEKILGQTKFWVLQLDF